MAASVTAKADFSASFEAADSKPTSGLFGISVGRPLADAPAACVQAADHEWTKFSGDGRTPHGTS
jgi:hypothetical protein